MAPSSGGKLSAALGSALFFAVAPGTIAGLLPWLISGWRPTEPPPALPIRVLGGLLILAGLVELVEAFARFALQGIGTPAPLYPTRRLVVRGLYRHVRNPMYLAVFCTILGQGLLLGSPWLLVYAVLVAIGFDLFVIAYEEPTLRRRFGDEYALYCDNVRRWLPRLRPWGG